MGRRPPPVIPGVYQNPSCRSTDPCAACGAGVPEARVVERHGGMQMMLCFDFMACNERSGITAHKRQPRG